MKKSVYKRFSMWFVFAGTLFFSACTIDNETFNIDLLIGKWVKGTEYYRYDNNGSGVTWDTSDDVSEEEAQPFTWEFDSETNRLTLFHQMEMGGVIPKSYTLLVLTEEKLSYKDNYGQIFTFTPAN